ncbi:MAG: TPM domain-containing protein [Bacteroidota bacterium]
MMLGALKTKPFFSNQEKERIMAAIEEAEKRTSGEIRVHVEAGSGKDPIDRAKEVFEKLGMVKTELRNGVLIYLATKEHRFAIIGDQGIDRVVPANFWEDTKERMGLLFKEGRFVDGVCYGVKSVGEHLAAHFPYKRGDVNELSNEISEQA